MRVDLFGLTMDAPGVTFYLWSPWRCAALEHKLFDAIKGVPNASIEEAADEVRVHVTDPKGWEEASDVGKDERRGWRWLLEADVDASGYDMQGERASFWWYVRLSLDRGGPSDAEKGEDIDLNGFGVQVWGTKE